MNTVQAIAPRAARPRAGGPIDWQSSALEPLPWFPFTVAMSHGQDDAAAFCADAAERRYWKLARRYGIKPRMTLLILDRNDWSDYAEDAAWGTPHHAGESTIVVPADAAQRPVDADRAVAEPLARLFAASAAMAKAA